MFLVVALLEEEVADEEEEKTGLAGVDGLFSFILEWC
jgi:hypothetical protein